MVKSLKAGMLAAKVLYGAPRWLHRPPTWPDGNRTSIRYERRSRPLQEFFHNRTVLTIPAPMPGSPSPSPASADRRGHELRRSASYSEFPTQHFLVRYTIDVFPASDEVGAPIRSYVPGLPRWAVSRVLPAAAGRRRKRIPQRYDIPVTAVSDEALRGSTTARHCHLTRSNSSSRPMNGKQQPISVLQDLAVNNLKLVGKDFEFSDRNLRDAREGGRLQRCGLRERRAVGANPSKLIARRLFPSRQHRPG